MKYAPIILFVYNRPDHLRQTVESLQKNEGASESTLFIFSDGPKDEPQAGKVHEVRDYLKRISGFREVTVIERKENMGLARSVIAGVSEIIGRYGRVIVLEDDLVVSRYFLEYMNKALIRYENEEKVMQVSGNMFRIKFSADVNETFFLPLTTTWGWGTWLRAWKLLDEDLTRGRAILLADERLRSFFDMNGAYPFFGMIDEHLAGKVNSWGIKWYVSVFLNDGLILHPKVSLVKHIGFDSEATHAQEGADYYADAVADSSIDYYPDNICVDDIALRDVIQRFAEYKKHMRSLRYRISIAMKRMINMLNSLARCVLSSSMLP